MTSQQWTSKLVEARNNLSHCVVRNVEAVTPAWADILAELNRTVQHKERLKTLDSLGFVLLQAQHIPGVSSMVSVIENITDAKCSAHCYISLLESSATFGRHNDNADVFFWQVQGSTHWTVEQGTEVYEYELAVNDLIYIPRFMIHAVVPLTPRAGISIGIDY
jgi:ribosomal protein L16 Arg81 hydroxylase